jgi:hypothetical protein
MNEPRLGLPILFGELAVFPGRQFPEFEVEQIDE